MTQPGTFQRVRTQSGWHLVLRAANHEPVIVGEPLTDPDSVTTALASVLRTADTILDRPIWPDHIYLTAAAAALSDVDERTQETT